MKITCEFCGTTTFGRFSETWYFADFWQPFCAETLNCLQMVDPGQVSDTGLVHPNNTTYVLDTNPNKKDTTIELCTVDHPKEYPNPKSDEFITQYMYLMLIQTKRTIPRMYNNKNTSKGY